MSSCCIAKSPPPLSMQFPRPGEVQIHLHDLGRPLGPADLVRFLTDAMTRVEHDTGSGAVVCAELAMTEAGERFVKLTVHAAA